MKPFLRGRDVKRWGTEFADQYLIKLESSENKPHPWSDRPAVEAERIFAKTYPAIHDHFKSVDQPLKNRYDQGKYFWELRACAYWELFEHPKILYPDIYEHQSFAWDDQGFYAANTCYFIPTDQKWLLGLLNSSLIEWSYSLTSNKVRGGYLRAFSTYMSQIPIPSPPETYRQLIERLVDYLILLKRDGSSRKDESVAGYFEQLVNGLVYELFFEPELHEQKLFMFKYLEEAKPPSMHQTPEERKRAALIEFHEKISDLNHPIRSCVFALRSLEVVRIIEGE